MRGRLHAAAGVPIMRIAQIAPLYESVPPHAYGATERIVHYLTEALVARGHDVTLFASGDSRTSAHLVPSCERALWRDRNVWDTQAHHLHQLGQLARRAHDFDIVHFHGEPLHFPLARYLPCRHITTLHGLLLPNDHGPLLRTFADVPLVSISRSQRTPLPWARWQRTVHHGIPPDELPYAERAGEYLLFMGRITPGKRPDLAIEIACRADVPLKIAAVVHEGERAYFHETIEPLIARHRRHVEFLGEVGGEARARLLCEARALLMPIDWEEPFGLVIIEAMACGTPTIAFRRGAIPEIVEDGLNGRVVDDVESAVAAVHAIGDIDRRTCRRVFDERFTAQRMTGDYLSVYESLLARQPYTPASPYYAGARVMRRPAG